MKTCMMDKLMPKNILKSKPWLIKIFKTYKTEVLNGKIMI